MREPQTNPSRLAHRPDPVARIGLRSRPTRRTRRARASDRLRVPVFFVLFVNFVIFVVQRTPL